MFRLRWTVLSCNPTKILWCVGARWASWHPLISSELLSWPEYSQLRLNSHSKSLVSSHVPPPALSSSGFLNIFSFLAETSLNVALQFGFTFATVPASLLNRSLFLSPCGLSTVNLTTNPNLTWYVYPFQSLKFPDGQLCLFVYYNIFCIVYDNISKSTFLKFPSRNSTNYFDSLKLGSFDYLLNFIFIYFLLSSSEDNT